MESTGGTDRPAKDIPKEHYKYIPSIQEQGLSEKQNRKRLQTLFDKYLKPKQNDSKTLDISKEWGRHFKEGVS